MRAFILMMLWVVGSVHAASERTERVLDGLWRLGQGVLEQELEQRREAQEAAGRAAAETTEVPEKTWRKRGADMVGTFLGTAAEELGKRSASEVLAFSLKDSLDVLIDEYKEQYKKEGRDYARELGDRLVERVKEDPKISSALTALEVLCWSIIAYLSVVTVFVFWAFISLRRGNGKLRREFALLSRKFDALRADMTPTRSAEKRD